MIASSLSHGTNACTSDGNATENATVSCLKPRRPHAGQLASRFGKIASTLSIELSANLTRCNAHSNATPAVGPSLLHPLGSYLNLTEY